MKIRNEILYHKPMCFVILKLLNMQARLYERAMKKCYLSSRYTLHKHKQHHQTQIFYVRKKKLYFYKTISNTYAAHSFKKYFYAIQNIFSKWKKEMTWIYVFWIQILLLCGNTDIKNTIWIIWALNNSSEDVEHI